MIESTTALPVTAGTTEVVCQWPNTRKSVARTRRELTAVLCVWDMAALADTAVLVLSELVTNAVLHARVPRDRLIETRFVRLPGSRLRIEVHDAGDGVPLMRRAAGDADSGRGLALVNGRGGGHRAPSRSPALPGRSPGGKRTTSGRAAGWCCTTTVMVGRA